MCPLLYTYTCTLKKCMCKCQKYFSNSYKYLLTVVILKEDQQNVIIALNF